MVRFPRISLRAKLLLASSFLLVLPYIGYRYVNEMERYLRAGLEGNLLDSARAIASALNERPVLSVLTRSPTPEADVLVHNLGGPAQVDGYISDWSSLGLEPNQLRPITSSRFAASYIAGRHQDYLYLFVHVTDDDVHYAKERTLGRGLSDHIALSTAGVTVLGSHIRNRYIIDTVSPGWAQAALNTADDEAPERAYRIRAEWQTHSDGYNVEMRIPLDLIRDGVAIDVINRARARDEQSQRLSTGPTTTGVYGGTGDGVVLAPPDAILGQLVLMSSQLESLVKDLGGVPGRRVWVIDGDARVRAQHGTLQTAPEDKERHPLFDWMLSPPQIETLTTHGLSRLTDPVVRAALDGKPGTRWRRSPGQSVPVVSAAFPISLGAVVVGSVLVEETAGPIQTVRREALADLFMQTIVATSLAALVLAWLASRLGGRIARLRDQANNAIDAQGRVRGDFTVPAARDEIGDLGHSIADMLERLRRYNEYLELLASRLSHELRTPIAVIRSSLENLQHGDTERAAVYTDRAMQGLTRLNTIITRMGEATRLEQTVQAADVEAFDLGHVVRQTAEGYRQIWLTRQFNVDDRLRGEATVLGVPDLLVQALDKLVANANELSPENETIEIRLDRLTKSVSIEIDNIGPPLPTHLGDQIFDSLVTHRETEGDDPHLGLGLYIVRLIAQFHRGTVSAQSRSDGRGVIFRLVVPVE
jgi:two-component system sensor histidine kinase ChvG